MDRYNVIRQREEYIPDPNEDIVENVPTFKKDLIIETPSTKSIYMYRFSHMVWLLLGAIETFLLFRFMFKMFEANTVSGFTDFIYMVSAPLVHPFSNILPHTIRGLSIIEWSTIIAMFVYLVLSYGISEIVHVLMPLETTKRKYISKRTRYAL